MKKSFACVAASLLMASGMVFAQAIGDLPASTGAANQSGLSATVSPTYKLPGVVGTEETPSVGFSPRGETPATGVLIGQWGSVEPKSSLLPGIDSIAAI